MDTNAEGEKTVSLKCLAPDLILAVNNIPLRKDQEVLLKGGDEIVVSGSSEPYSYVFTPHTEAISEPFEHTAPAQQAELKAIAASPRAVRQSSMAQPEAQAEGEGVEDKAGDGPRAMEVQAASPLAEGRGADSPRQSNEDAQPGPSDANTTDACNASQVDIKQPLKGNGHVLLAGPGVQPVHISPSDSPSANALASLPLEHEQIRATMLQLFGSLGLGRSKATDLLPMPPIRLPSQAEGGRADDKAAGRDGQATVDEAGPSEKAAAKQSDSPSAADAAASEPVPDETLERHAKQVDTFREEIAKLVVRPDDIDVSLESFPHYLSKGTKHRLLSAAFVHLKKTEFAKHTSSLPSMSNKVLLSGPFGSDIYQEKLVRGLAKDMGAQLLVYDHTQLLADVTNEEEREDKAGQPGGALPGLLDGEDDDDLDYFGTDDDRSDKGELSQAWRTTGPSGTRSWTAGPLSMIRKRVRYSNDNTLAAAAAAAAGGGGPHRVGAGPSSAHRCHKGAVSGQVFKVGDRVRYVGGSASREGAAGGPGAHGGGPILGLPNSIPGLFCGMPAASSSRREHPHGAAAPAKESKGPWPGLKGRVVVTVEDPKKVGVRFDQTVPGGSHLGKKCEEGHGFYCSASELRLESAIDRLEEANSAATDALFDTAAAAMKAGPLVLLVKELEKYLMEDTNRYMQFAKRLEGLAGPLLVVGSHTTDVRRERGGAGSLFSRLGSHPLLDLGFIDGIPRLEERSRNETSKAAKYLGRLLPNRITLHPPQEEPVAAEWKRMLEADVAAMRENANRGLIRGTLARCGLECGQLDAVVVRDQALTSDSVEKVVGWAVANHLMSDGGAGLEAGAKLQLEADNLSSAVEMLRTSQAEAQPTKNVLKDVVTENEFEKRLLSEVIPADEVGVGFDDIGALENVKQTLREVVMLPLQRPELFSRGSLTKPTKGVLLFGPPGTGKTMLAKAVASESGANFINASMSSLASKWFGEGEKYVRALFSLAHKIAPSVIFIDEVDSMLGRRDKSGEHEAMRKIKNEFMANWDGLRTCESDRVLVLAATNRPMDLDEAVIRRMPRRLFVDLPDVANRNKVLHVILQHENLAKAFDYGELAQMTDGYSGSDLHNLCVAAAYRPIRDFLKAEKAQGADSAAAPSDAPAALGAGAAGASEREAGDAGTSMQVDEGAPPAAAAGDLQPGGSTGDGAVAAAGAVSAAASSGGGGGAQEGEEEEKKNVQLRALTLADFRAAMEQVGASLSQDAHHMSELQQWNEMYGEGGTRRKSPLPYFM